MNKKMQRASTFILESEMQNVKKNKKLMKIDKDKQKDAA